MIVSEQVTKIGISLKPHGIKGEFCISIDCDISEISCIIINIDGIYVPFFLESFRPKNNDLFIVKIKGYENEMDVAELLGLEIFALKEEVLRNSDDSGGLYAEDLIDYKIIDEKGDNIGVIIDIDVSTDNALFIVENINKKEIYIPIVDEFILDINEKEKIIQMELPIGLLEI